LMAGRGSASAQNAVTPNWGSLERPFAANSLWNARPVAPVFGDFVIPRSDYFPSVAEGKWSTGVFLSKANDRPLTVTGLPGSKGLWDPDAEEFHDVTIPRWPEDVNPASAADGHADIVDTVAGIIHSFFQLRNQGGRWMAAHYAWSPIDGRGWGDPAHYFQGARAAGVPTMAGLIRKHEVQDGKSLYRHALAVSLTFNALSPKPAYVFPATSADTSAATTNFGSIPEGALVMLPPSFETGRISSLALRKVAETLKVFGAYVVDRNFGTPFAIYVENGSGFNLHEGGWNNAVASDLDSIRASLRQVTSASGYLDGNGQPFVPPRNLNLLSMRGPWRVELGSAPGVFDTWRQSVVFPVSAVQTVQVNSSSRGMNPVTWAIPAAGTRMQLTSAATGGAKLRLQLLDRTTGTVIQDSNELGNAEAVMFAWPRQQVSLVLRAISGVGQPSSVRATLVEVGK